MDQREREDDLLTTRILRLEIASLKELVNTRLNSMDKAIEKSEGIFTKQVDQISVLISTSIRSIDSKITDLQTRVNQHEGSNKGMKDMYGWVVGIAGIVVAVGSFFIHK